MKQYNCPDCALAVTSCKGCPRVKTNIYEPSEDDSPQTIQFLDWLHHDTVTSPYEHLYSHVPPACRNCSNHPLNGGSGYCNCTLGGWTVY